MKKNREAPIYIIRKRRKQEAHHGGAWKVAFADFMTAMFSLFLVLWLINQSTDIKSAIAGYFQDPLGRAGEFGSSIMPGTGSQSQAARQIMDPSDITSLRKDRLQFISKRLNDKFSSNKELTSHMEITLTDEGLRIELLEGAEGYFFEKGASTPTPTARDVLALLGSELATLTLPVRIEGHTDAHPYHADKNYTNWELSADRANAARRILVENGMPPAQIAQVEAFADRRLRVPEEPFSPRNRRVTIVMLLGTEAAEADSLGAGADSLGAVADSTIATAGF